MKGPLDIIPIVSIYEDPTLYDLAKPKTPTVPITMANTTYFIFFPKVSATLLTIEVLLLSVEVRSWINPIGHTQPQKLLPKIDPVINIVATALRGIIALERATCRVSNNPGVTLISELIPIRTGIGKYSFENLHPNGT